MNSYDKWYQEGRDNGYLTEYIKHHLTSLEKARIVLEKSFTPELRELLEKYYGKEEE